MTLRILQVVTEERPEALCELAQAVAAIDTTSASTSCTLWPQTIDATGDDAALCSKTDASLRNMLFASIKAAALRADSFDVHALVAHGMACNGLGRFASAQEPLRRALALSDSAALRLLPCELEVTERETSVSSSQRESTLTPPQDGCARPSATKLVSLHVACSHEALCDSAESSRSCGWPSGGDEAELPVSRQSSGASDEVITIALAHSSIGAPQLTEQQQHSIPAACAGAPHQHHRLSDVLCTRVCHQLALALYMQATGAAQLPPGDGALHCTQWAQSFVCVAERSGDFTSQQHLQQLYEAARLLSRAATLLQSCLVHGAKQQALQIDLLLADIEDGQGKCQLELGSADSSWQHHRRALRLRQRHGDDLDISLGHSHLHLGLAAQGMQVCFVTVLTGPVIACHSLWWCREDFTATLCFLCHSVVQQRTVPHPECSLHRCRADTFTASQSSSCAES